MRGLRRVRSREVISLTSVTAGLVYSGESGGLNEATSDIFAAAVEFAAGNSSDVGDYLVGEKGTRRRPRGGRRPAPRRAVCPAGPCSDVGRR